MSSDIALRVEGLGKKYTIRHKDHDHVTLAQAALHRIRHPRGATNREEFWALDDVSFEVPRGEVLGVIGHNGAGKSTLLKILSRITPPTKGRVEVFGRIGSLLEVGTGFHPELTGRENVYLNGSILGMKKKEIDRQFDAIVDFSGVEQFLDTPVKRYSSGMYVRLAFAVAAHLDTEILLLDEVLAVGDIEFQKRCLGKMSQVAAGGRTVVVVTHAMPIVIAIARSCLLLDTGRVVAYEPTRDAAARYAATISSDTLKAPLASAPRPDFDLTRHVKIVSADLECRLMNGKRTLEISLTTSYCRDRVDYGVVLNINHHASSPVGTAIVDQITDDGNQHLAVDISGLTTGRYTVTFALTTPFPREGHVDHDVVLDALEFLVEEGPRGETRIAPITWGPIRFASLWTRTK